MTAGVFRTLKVTSMRFSVGPITNCALQVTTPKDAAMQRGFKRYMIASSPIGFGTIATEQPTKPRMYLMSGVMPSHRQRYILFSVILTNTIGVKVSQMVYYMTTFTLLT